MFACPPLDSHVPPAGKSAESHWQAGPERFRELCRLRALPDDAATLLEMGRRWVAECEVEVRRWSTRRRINERRAEKGLAPDVD